MFQEIYTLSTTLLYSGLLTRLGSYKYLHTQHLASLAWPDRFRRKRSQRASRSDKKTVWPRETNTWPLGDIITPLVFRYRVRVRQFFRFQLQFLFISFLGFQVKRGLIITFHNNTTGGLQNGGHL